MRIAATRFSKPSFFVSTSTTTYDNLQEFHMTFYERFKHLLNKVGNSSMSSAAYDTAWTAQLVDLWDPLGEAALEWLRANQLDDGSWGALRPAYFHDRLICTLAGTIALAKYGVNGDAKRVQRAKVALNTTIRDLAQEASVETIAFEMITPTLLNEAERLGVLDGFHYDGLEKLNRQRVAKLSKLPKGMINRNFTLAFSAEMVGYDGMKLLEVEQLQEANGSLGNSPSATAYFALNVDKGNIAALDYLRKMPTSDAGIPNVSPIDVFEAAWVLWNLDLVGGLDEEMMKAADPHLKHLLAAWVPGQGVGPSSELTPKDSDDTSLTLDVLYRYGYEVDVEAILSYEESDHFRCYPLEANPSVSANIHVLGALRTAGFPADHPSVQKIVSFLRHSQYWQDKWHVSPYYVTSHAIISATGYIDGLVENAVKWILSTQNEDGSWGYFYPTAEETAYCLQALVVRQRYGHPIDSDVLQRGLDWLIENTDPPYPPLWIGKCLYTPIVVVQSTILGATMMTSQALGVSL
jgi:halimadienyl-diphosphate synthase